MTVTIDLTPTEEANMTAARRQGLGPAALLKRLLAQLAPDDAAPAAHGLLAQTSETSARRQAEERWLVAEHHALRDREGDGALSEAHAVRLRQIEAGLDALEDQDPVEQNADRLGRETGDKLDAILALLQSLPRKTAAP